MMRSESDTEFLTSPLVVMTVLTAIVCIVSLGAEILFYPWTVVSTTMAMVILLAAGAAAVALLVDRHPLAARWLTVLAITLVVHAAELWLPVRGTLAWTAIPTAYAACLLGIPAAAVVAIGESAAAVLLAQTSGAPADVALSAVFAIWAIFLAMVALSHEARRQVLWYAGYFQQAQRLLAEAFDHRAELSQALDDLAHANRQLALLNRRVVALQEIAERAQEAKTRFVARVSHEFRTPLNMIIGLTDLLAEKPEIYDASLSPRMRDALRIVHRNSQHLSDMVNDVLDLSRIETDHVVLHRERVSIQEIVDVAVEAIRPLLENKRLLLHVKIDDNVPDIYCDRTRIEQVVLNLVSNAVRYTDQGQIVIGAVRQAQFVHVHVTDTGQGIAPRDLESIFEPFSQGTSAIWRDKGGTGLGLSISKHFIELHDGRIWVESELGVGTTFTFELPVSSPIEQIIASSPGPAAGQKIQEDWIWHERRSGPKLPEAHLRPRLVLYDAVGDLFDCVDHFSSDVELINAHTRAEVVTALQQAPAHAVLVNLESSAELDGWVETIPHESKGTPIIGCSVQNSLVHARSMGLRGQLIKPITRMDLAALLRQMPAPVKKVVVVDDGADEIEMLSQMLWACDPDLKITAAQNGAAAMQMLRTMCAAPPDLLLLDIVMPEMNGWQVLEAMAADAGMPKVPTYFVSAQDPYERPPHSSFMTVAAKGGLSLTQLLRCSLAVSSLLLQPEGRSDPAPG